MINIRVKQCVYCSYGEGIKLFPFTHRTMPLPEKSGQGLIEYALILSLVAIVVIVALAVMGTTIRRVYCQVISQFPGNETPCDEIDMVVITKADYDSLKQELHLDATSNGDFDPTVTLTASPGGLMEERSDHYHLTYSLPGCSCIVTVTSSAGGSASITVGP
jgi:Flp pilus assembly pilin Flp